MELVYALRVIAAPYWRPRAELVAGEFGRPADLVFYEQRPGTC
jgi:hypothetical protein